MARYEKAEAFFDFGPFFSLVIDDPVGINYAIGVNHKIRSDLVVKLEHHWYEGFEVENVSLNVFFDEPHALNYTILSLSISF